MTGARHRGVRASGERPRTEVNRTAPELDVTLRFDWRTALLDTGTQSKLTPADVVLLLLRAGKISGRTMFQKQVFLAYHEVFGPREAIDPGFVPSMYGPFSQLVADLPAALRAAGRVGVLPRGQGHSTYVLRSLGAADVRALGQRPLVSRRMEQLVERKARWDEWNTLGIMRYVYRNYPEYATKTMIPSLIWE